MPHMPFISRSIFLVVACVMGATASDAATVAHYRFENGTAGEVAVGKGTIVDSSGHGLDASPWGKPRYEAVGNPDSTLALRLDGIDAHASVPDHPLFQLTQSLTLEAYVYLKKDACRTGGGIIVRSDNRYDFDPYYLSVFPGCILGFLIEHRPNQGTLLQAAGLPVEQWLHVAGTLDDATGLQALYVNGSLVDSAITPWRPFAKLPKSNHPAVVFGATVKGSPDQAYLHGSIDEVRISDVALDPSQFLPPPVR